MTRTWFNFDFSLEYIDLVTYIEKLICYDLETEKQNKITIIILSFLLINFINHFSLPHVYYMLHDTRLRLNSGQSKYTNAGQSSFIDISYDLYHANTENY